MTNPLGIANMDDVRRIEQKPLSQLNLPGTVLDAVKLGLSRSDNRPAIRFVPDAAQYARSFEISYDQLIERIARTATGLKTLSAAPVVSILLPNLPETHYVLWGAQMVGRSNPINPLLDVEKIADIMTACGTTILITLANVPGTDLFEKGVEAARQAGVKTIVTVDPTPYASFPRNMVGRLLTGLKTKTSGLRLVSFKNVLRAAPLEEASYSNREAVGALFHTGGTTGSPKVAQLTHANQVFVGWAAARNRFMEQNKSIFCGLPLFHVNGALITGLVSFMNGATVVLGPPQGYRSPGLFYAFWDIIEHYEIGAMSGVPAVYRTLLDIPIGDRDVSALEFGVCGAAPIAKATLETFQNRTGLIIQEGYGMTEGSCISTINPGYGERRLGSVGLRIPYQDLKILKRRVEGDYIECVPNEVGLVAIAGPNVFAGYLDPSDDAKAWIDFGGRRYYNSGDLGRLDMDGYLWLTGREKELIIRGGHNIDPKTIEEALSKHPDVEAVAAIGSPDPRVGEMPVAYVQLKGDSLASQDDLLRLAKREIPERAAIPKQVIIIDTMPMTAVGKIFKPELERREAERSVISLIAAHLPGEDVRLEARRSNGVLSVHIDFTDHAINASDQVVIKYALRDIPIQTDIKFDMSGSKRQRRTSRS